LLIRIYYDGGSVPTSVRHGTCMTRLVPRRRAAGMTSPSARGSGARTDAARHAHLGSPRWLLLWWLVWLGAAPLFDVDEGAFAEASREMLTSGDWGHTTLNGADRFEQAHPVYWLQAASLAVFAPRNSRRVLPRCAHGLVPGVGPLPPALGPQGGAAAAVVVATSLGPLAIGRAATADALLNCCWC